MKTILYVDNSALSKSSCTRRLSFLVREGLVPLHDNINIMFGVAFHKGIQTYKESLGDLNLAIRSAQEVLTKSDAVLDKSHAHYNTSLLTGLLMRYITEVLPVDTLETVSVEGKPLVEKGFRIPLCESENFEAWLCGTLDDICKVKSSGLYCNRDYKTTSAKDSALYFDSYRLSSQLLTYQYAIYWHAERFPDSIFGEMVRRGVTGAFIEGVFIRQDVMASFFQRSQVFLFNKELVYAYIAGLKKHVSNWLAHLENGTDASAMDGIITGACTASAFGKCQFYNICINQSELATQQQVKQQYFRAKLPYDPLHFND